MLCIDCASTWNSGGVVVMARVFNIVTVANVHSLLFSVQDIVSMHQFLCTHCSGENKCVLYSQYCIHRCVRILHTVYIILCGHDIAVGGGGELGGTNVDSESTV